MSRSTGIIMPKSFMEALVRKIKDIRYLYDIPHGSNQMKGKLFWDDESAIELVASSVTGGGLSHNGEIIGAGLTFDEDALASGRYDALISATLSKLAEIDYQRETSLDFH
jgi:hypothetical protein